MPNTQPNFIHKTVYLLRLITSFEIACGCTLSFYVGGLFAVAIHDPSSSIISGLWSMISTILVFNVDIKKMWRNGYGRAIGTFCGAVGSGIFFYWLGDQLWVFLVCAFVVMIILALLRVTSYRVAILTVGLIYAVQHIYHISVWENAGVRFLESIIGILVALAVASVIYPVRKYFHFFDSIEP